MKRLALFAATCACAMWVGATGYSQTSGGGGRTGGGTSGETGSGGATGGTGSGGVQGGTGSGAGGGANIGGQPGAGAQGGIGLPGGPVPPGRQTVPIIPFGGTGQAGQAGQAGQPGQAGGQSMRNQFGGPRQTPWFSDPTVRQQLRMNDAQFNSLNTGYRDAWNRYNQNVRGANAATQRAQQSQRQDARQQQQGAQQRQQDFGRNGPFNQRGTASSNQANIAGSRLAQQQPAQRMQQLQQSFDDDFSRVVDSTFTDPVARQRYNELYLQYQGVGAFSNPAVAQQLNLNPQQQAQFGQLSQQWNDALARLQVIHDQDPQGATQQYNELRRQANEQLTTLLSPQQLANWRRMSGAQFEFPAQTYLRQSPQSLDPTGDQTREQVNQELENQQNDSIFDSNRVPGQSGSEIGTEANPGSSRDLNVGDPQNDSAPQ